MANSVNPDRMLHSAASDQSLHCLLKPVCPNIYKYCRLLHYLLEILKIIFANSVDPDQTASLGAV